MGTPKGHDDYTLKPIDQPQKVSGHFRTLEGAKQFAEIRGFMSTLRKQDRDILSSLFSVTRGEFSFN